MKNKQTSRKNINDFFNRSPTDRKQISEAIIVDIRENLIIIEDTEDHSFVILNKKELEDIVSFAKGVLR